MKSFYLLIRYRPRLVIGVGGYSSGPMILASWLLRRPRIILEQNVRPGFTNRLLRYFVPRVITAFEATLPFFGQKGIFLGNPVRPEFYSIKPRKKRSPFTLLVFGGSQGSRFLNQLMTDTLSFLKPVKDKIHIIHQTGSQDHSWVKKVYLDHSFNSAEVEPFFFEMPAKFNQADLLICRSGATTLAEIIAACRTAVLIPFARAAENHQYWNAYELFSRGAARMMTENEARPEKLAEKILNYLEHPEKLEVIEARLAELKVSEPEEKIASFCLELMREKKKRAVHG
jgi:UDP-N-acetylglucosamine--N-acetylmuramyl-(pentapeptide) pyrophosphoryl-undecaprenol N-acetylglucosamine transferase